MTHRRFMWVIAVVLCAVLSFSGQAWSDQSPRDKVVNYAYEVLNYTWTTDGYIVLHDGTACPTIVNGKLSFTPTVVTGTIKGIPYSLSSCSGVPLEKSFSEYKALSASDRKLVSQRYWYGVYNRPDNGYRVSMQYGMSCTTFVWDCISQALTGVGRTAYCPDVPTLWSEHITRTSYSELQKGDILWNKYHVMLVVANNLGSSRLTVIEQASPNWSNTQSIGTIYLPPHGYYNAKLCNTYTVGTREKTYTYSDVSSYTPYRVNYTEVPVPSREISPGLKALTSSKYAKVYTAEWAQYKELYSDREFRNSLYPSNWIDEYEECRIIEVGSNSAGKIYAKILFPLSNGTSLKEGYVDLQKAFVPGAKTDGVRRTVSRSKSVYRRANYATIMNSAAIDAGADTYLLTEVNGWCEVLYETSVRNVWRIVWMTAWDYEDMFKHIPILITAVNLNAAVAGSYYRGTFTASGATPITWKTSNGTKSSSALNQRIGLPPGLSISGSGTTGTISGTIAHTDAGKDSYMPLMYHFNVTASNSSGSSAPKQSYIDVYEPPVFETSSTLTSGDLNKPYSQTIKAKGTEWSMRWKIVEGKLPPGLQFNATNSKRTATITGKPTQTGCFRFTIRCYNLVGNSDTTTKRQFTIYVGNVASEYRDTRMQFRHTYFYDGSAGKSYRDYIGIADTSLLGKRGDLKNYIFSVSEGSLPPGLSIEEQEYNGYNVGKLYLSGVPKTSGTYNFTLKIKRISDGGCNTRSYTLKVSPASSTAWRNYSMSVIGSFLSGKMMENYNGAIAVWGGSSPYTPSVVAGELPPGTRLEASGSRIYLKGVPKRAGTFSFTVRVTASNNGYTERVCSVYIADNPSYKSGGSSNTKPKFLSKALPDAHVGSMWEATLECSGAEPIAWYAVGDLPDWMTLEEDTGRISGIPMELGKYKFKIKAENEKGSVTKTFKVKVVKSAPTIITASLPEGYKGAAYEAYLEALGTDPIKWSKIGKFPSGLKLDKKEGIIYGTPKKAGSFDITVKAKNKAGEETVQLSIVIREPDDPAGDDKEAENDEGDTSESTGQTNTPSNTGSAPTADSPDSGNTSDAVYTRLYLLSGDEKLEGYVPVEAGEPLTFEIGQWQDEYGRNIEVSDVAVFVNDEAVSADISEDGIFTLPAETVNGDFIVYASAHSGEREFRTLEISATAGEQESYVSASSAGNSEPAPSSHGGCSAGVFSVAGLICAGIFLFGRKPR